MPALKSEWLWISIQDCGNSWAETFKWWSTQICSNKYKDFWQTRDSLHLELSTVWNFAAAIQTFSSSIFGILSLVEYSLNNQHSVVVLLFHTTSNSNPETSILFNCILTFYYTKQWFFTMKIIDLSEWQTGDLFLGCQYTWTIPYKNLERCQGDKWMMFKLLKAIQ